MGTEARGVALNARSQVAVQIPQCARQAFLVLRLPLPPVRLLLNPHLKPLESHGEGHGSVKRAAGCSGHGAAWSYSATAMPRLCRKRASSAFDRVSASVSGGGQACSHASRDWERKSTRLHAEHQKCTTMCWSLVKPTSRIRSGACPQ